MGGAIKDATPVLRLMGVWDSIIKKPEILFKSEKEGWTALNMVHTNGKYTDV
jgi:hypothetical protein